MTAIRVLALIDSLQQPGGAERLAVELACALPRDRFEVEICATRTAGGLLTERLDDAGIAWFALGRRGKLDVLPLRRLVAHLRERRTQVVHSHMSGSNLWGTIVARQAGVPVLVAHEHGSPYSGGLGRLIRFLDRRIIGPRASAIVVGTDAERARLVELGRVAATKVVVIPAPLLGGPTGDADLRAELGIGAGVPLVGTVAWLRPEKRLEDLIEAFAALPDSLREARLVIAGDGPCRDELERLATIRGIGGRTHFLGPRADPVAVLGALDAAAITSARESTSLMALEAAAAGTPLVSTRVGGPAEYFTDGVSALLVEPGDVRGIARALSEVLTDPERARRMAAAASSILDRFSLEEVAAQHAALYERLLASATSRHTRS